MIRFPDRELIDDGERIRVGDVARDQVPALSGWSDQQQTLRSALRSKITTPASQQTLDNQVR
jgi:hypothetical protein